MGTPIKLQDELVAKARAEAKTMNRSLAEQIGHWVRLGYALEHQPGVSLDRVRQALAGERPFDGLTREERAAYLAGLEERTFHPKGVRGVQEDKKAAGHPFVVLGDQGEAIEVAPDGTRRAIEDPDRYGREAA